MKNTNLAQLTLISSILFSASAFAEKMDHSQMDHSKMTHADHMKMMESMEKTSSPIDPIAPIAPTTSSTPSATESTKSAINTNATPLKEAGNTIFGTIQEVITKLDADPNTDWSKVDIEGLRQHLIDMENFTSGVDVLSQKDIEKGAEVVIRAKSEEAHHSLSRALKAHPSMMESETGWTMDVKQNKERFTLKIETQKPDEVARLRALGYIGAMALGNHHQIHHWMMASGANPHGEHMHH